MPDVVTLITDVLVPAEAFPLGRILTTYPTVEIELERIVPTSEAIIPLFWVATDVERAVEATLRSDPIVEAIAQLTRTEDRILYAIHWTPDVDGLVRTIVDLGVDVLAAEGTADAWEFRLQFRDRTDLKRFRRACREEHIDLQLLELYNPLMPVEKGPLDADQHDALATAYENGYWDVPRGITLEELARLMGLRERTLSRYLREGARIAAGELIFGPGGKPFE